MFIDENIADNVFVIASKQFLKTGSRADGLDTDGGASLLHAGVTILEAA